MLQEVKVGLHQAALQEVRVDLGQDLCKVSHIREAGDQSLSVLHTGGEVFVFCVVGEIRCTVTAPQRDGCVLGQYVMKSLKCMKQRKQIIPRHKNG